ncbi:MAG: dihydroneopterin aldolase [Burkholderiales bacterium]|nr:dihydroneopterin aldolase [Burkholderiales bacterium]
MDAILLRDLRVEALIGIHRRERYAPQTVSLDLDIGLPGEAVFASDRVADTIDYEKVAARIRELAASWPIPAVETFAERIARLSSTNSAPRGCAWSAAKVGILANARLVGVSIERRRA